MIFRLPNDISETVIEAIEKKIYYISEKISSYKILNDNGSKYIDLTIDTDTDTSLIEKRLNSILEESKIANNNSNNKIIWSFDNQNEWNYKNILEKLLSEKIVCIHGEGQISLKQPLIKLITLFDNIFSTISRERFKSEEHIFPTLLKTSVLKKVGYFDSFPNLLMFTLRLRNEVENYYDFKENYKELNSADKIGDELINYLCTTDYSLPPTMCYYVYDMFSNNVINNCSVTTKGKSFRYENKYLEPFKRLSDFTIRETVFLGDRNYVKKSVSEYRHLSTRVMESLGIKSFCELANDPFFLVDDMDNKIKAQNILGSKYELRTFINSLESIAVASFNLHGQFLSKRFKLYLNKENSTFINTGCVGVGLERFLYGFITQYGINEENWPNIIKDLLNEKVSVSDFVSEL